MSARARRGGARGQAPGESEVRTASLHLWGAQVISSSTAVDSRVRAAAGTSYSVWFLFVLNLCRTGPSSPRRTHVSPSRTFARGTRDGDAIELAEPQPQRGDLVREGAARRGVMLEAEGEQVLEEPPRREHRARGDELAQADGARREGRGRHLLVAADAVEEAARDRALAEAERDRRDEPRVVLEQVRQPGGARPPLGLSSERETGRREGVADRARGCWSGARAADRETTGFEPPPPRAHESKARSVAAGGRPTHSLLRSLGDIAKRGLQPHRKVHGALREKRSHSTSPSIVIGATCGAAGAPRARSRSRAAACSCSRRNPSTAATVEAPPA